jgi:hypothetical protein
MGRMTPERRFEHGLGWGAAATVVMGAVALLMMAVRLWPIPGPVSLALARVYLGRAPLPMLLLAVAVVQLVYGALCGGLLSVLSEPVTMGSALGLGLVRWLTTQWIVLPALGWAEFGLGRAPALLVATAIPHLAWSLAVGWLMHREDERTSAPIPAPSPG